MSAAKPNAFRVDEDHVAIGDLWFSSAFEVAVGSGIGEVCRRFSADIKSALALHEADAADRLSAEEILPLVRAIQWRMSVAAEWAERLESVEREAAK